MMSPINERVIGPQQRNVYTRRRTSTPTYPIYVFIYIIIIYIHIYTTSYVCSLRGELDMCDVHTEHGGEPDLQFRVAGRYQMSYCARKIT